MNKAKPKKGNRISIRMDNELYNYVNDSVVFPRKYKGDVVREALYTLKSIEEQQVEVIPSGYYMQVCDEKDRARGLNVVLSCLLVLTVVVSVASHFPNEIITYLRGLFS